VSGVKIRDTTFAVELIPVIHPWTIPLITSKKLNHAKELLVYCGK